MIIPFLYFCWCFSILLRVFAVFLFFYEFSQNFQIFNKCLFVEFVDRFRNQNFFVDFDFNKSTNKYLFFNINN